MTLIVPRNGEGDGLAWFVNKTDSAGGSPQNLVLKLFKNNIVPAETDVAGTFTEAAFAGYAAKTLTGNSWTITEGAPTTAAYAVQAFACNSTGTTEPIYGYFMIRLSSGRIALSEKFTDGPYNITNSGDTINLTPQITFN